MEILAINPIIVAIYEGAIFSVNIPMAPSAGLAADPEGSPSAGAGWCPPVM